MNWKRQASRATLTLALCSVLAWSGVSFAADPTTPKSTVAQDDLLRRAPAGSPNIVIVLLDDVGFGASSTFGGPAKTATLDRLAAEGLRYNRFHTTAICSPTRSSLLTGRNPHATGIGAVMNSADSRPGYSGFHRKDTATIAEILRQNGWSTGAFGKWHQTPDWELSQSGPFDRWPTGEGFEEFYGFQGGETDQFEPSLFHGTAPVLRPEGKNYHLTNDLVDHAIDWMRAQKSVTPDKPFLLYLAPGGIHAPIQVPQPYIERYRGRFDKGWDALREEIFKRELRLGIIPKNTRLTPRPEGMPAWESLTVDQKRFAARSMEAYAGFLEHTDEQIGRLVEALKDSGQFDNTLFVYIVGDNGASAEGTLEGSINYMGKFTGLPEPEAVRTAGIDRVGSASAYTHVPAAWAWANNTPFQWTKTVASHLGATRNAMVITWPRRIIDRGGLRSQFGHVNDIVPTVLEATGLQAPESINGIHQKPMNGVSLAYTFTDAKASERHRTQYFEVFGHRAIYHDGWMASAFHDRLPWKAFATKNTPFDQDKWQLYDLRSDFSQANDLAAREPAKLAELKTLFDREATTNGLLPLSNMRVPSGLPDLAAGVTSATYHMGAVAIPEKAVPRMFNRSWTLSADIDAASDSRGVIATIGGTSSGWSLYVDDQRRPVFTYRMFEIKTVTLTGQPLADGANSIKVEFDHQGPGMGRPANLRLIANGKAVANGDLPLTPWSMFSINETFDVGVDTGSPAGFYPASAPVGYGWHGGSIKQVKIDLR